MAISDIGRHLPPVIRKIQGISWVDRPSLTIGESLRQGGHANGTIIHNALICVAGACSAGEGING